ncbi:MAG: hypothetical protein AAF196_18600 [Planctomycetota bacterium]
MGDVDIDVDRMQIPFEIESRSGSLRTLRAAVRLDGRVKANLEFSRFHGKCGASLGGEDYTIRLVFMKGRYEMSREGRVLAVGKRQRAFSSRRRIEGVDDDVFDMVTQGLRRAQYGFFKGERKFGEMRIRSFPKLSGEGKWPDNRPIEDLVFAIVVAVHWRRRRAAAAGG